MSVMVPSKHLSVGVGHHFILVELLVKYLFDISNLLLIGVFGLVMSSSS